MRIFYPVVAVSLLLLATSLSITAQPITLTLNQTVTDTLTPARSTIEYEVTVRNGVSLEAALKFASREFPVRLMLQNLSGQNMLVNEGLNYPNFQGAYFYSNPLISGRYRIVVEAQNLNEPATFTLLVREAAPDTQGRTLRLQQPLKGTIGPIGDSDYYVIRLQRGVPVLFVVTVPDYILDPILGIIGPQGNLVAYNDDFYGINPVVIVTPMVTGDYTVIVEGSYIDESIGPYEINAKAIPLFNAPFNTFDMILAPGDATAIQIRMDHNNAYELDTVGTEDFAPFVVLMDFEGSILTYNFSDVEAPIAVIPGFTPRQGQDYFLLVLGDSIYDIGDFAVFVTVAEDEPDGIQLNHGDIFGGVIGPIGDVDEFLINVEANKPYSLLVTPTWHSLDPFIRVLDSSGNELFSNDDAADGLFSILSGIVFPATAEYRIQVSASPIVTDDEPKTGVYAIQFAEGATFDRGRPIVLEYRMSVQSNPNGLTLSIPPNAILDDTYPLKARVLIDRVSQELVFDLQKDATAELSIAAAPDDILFLTVTDSAFTQNTASPVVVPPPSVFASLSGQPFALAINKQNEIFVTYTQVGSVVRVNIDGSTQTILPGEETAGGTLGPNALAFDHQNVLYMSNGRTHKIEKVFPDGRKETFAQDLEYPVDIAFDESGVLYVGQLSSDTIIKILPNGEKQVFVNTIKNPQALAFSPTGRLFVGNSDGLIYGINPDGTADLLYADVTPTIHSIAFDQDGFLYVADGDRGVIYRISPEGETRRFARGLSGPLVDIAFGYGPYSKTLFASTLGLFGDALYIQELIAISTGRVGLSLPYSNTRITNWMLW